MYKIVLSKDTYTDKVLSEHIVRIEDNAWIPKDPDNTDYQRYLAWVAAGNTAQPATGAK